MLYSSRRKEFYPEYDDDDDEYYPPPATGFREMEDSLEQQYRDASSVRDPGFRSFEKEYPRRAALTRIDDREDKEEDYYESKEEEDLENPSGNFWLNPEGDLDPIDNRPSRRRPPQNPAKRNKPTTFRSGFPSVPQPVNELYNRLFWYGIDPDGSTSPADRTMFGGTKGKFNGLSYLNESDGIPRPARRRRSSGSRYPSPESSVDDNGGEYYGQKGERESYFEEDDFELDDYDFTSQGSQQEFRSTFTEIRRPVTPPYDPPVPRREVRRYSSRQQRNRSPDPDSWEATTVAKWFTVNGDKDEEEFDKDDRGFTRRKRQRGKDGWSAFDVVGAFLGLNKDDLQKQAKVYEQNMGIGKEPPTRRRRRGSPMPEVAKATFRNDPADLEKSEVPLYDDVIDTIANSVEFSRNTEESEVPTIELSWEERALAIERVPPSEIAAWGPSGELGLDARTKAVMDALEDIAGAKEIVDNRKKRVADYREEMTILRIDSELERKRLNESRSNYQAIGERLRRADLKMENVARKLRRSQINLKNAKQDLAELEARHWAVLGFYDPERAGVSMEDALLELKEQEPAVRRFYGKEVQVTTDGVELPSNNRDTSDADDNNR